MRDEHREDIPQFDVDEVEIYRRDEEVVLRKKPRDLGAAFELLTRLPGDFMQDGRDDPHHNPGKAGG